MADWIAIADSAVDPDAPVTSSLAYAWRDNPVAMAEGAPGAPKVSSDAMFMRFVNGSAASSGTVFTMNTLSRVSGIFVGASMVLNTTTGGGTLRFRTSTNGGSTWGSYTDLASFSNTNPSSLNYDFFNGIVTIPAGANSMQLNWLESGAGGRVLSAFGLAVRGVIP